MAYVDMVPQIMLCRALLMLAGRSVLIENHFTIPMERFTYVLVHKMGKAVAPHW